MTDLKNKRLINILSLEGRLTLGKWLERFCMGGLQYGFITWRQKTDNLRHRASFVQAVRTNLGKGYLRLAWSRWQQSIHNLSSETNQAYIERLSSTLIPEELLKINFKRKIHLATLSRTAEEAVAPEQQRQRLLKQRGVLMESMEQRVRECDKMSLMRFIVQTWSKHAKAAKRGGKALERGITKLMLQSGFDSIRKCTRAKDLAVQKQQFAKQLSRMYRRQRLRKSFAFWRCIEYNCEMAVIRKCKQQTRVEVETHREKVANTKASHSILWNNRSCKITLHALFDAWHAWSHLKAVHKRMAAELPVVRGKFLCKRSLLHWHTRIRATRKVQAQIRKTELARQQIVKAAVFQSMKHIFLLAKNMAVKTYNFMSALQHF